MHASRGFLLFYIIELNKEGKRFIICSMDEKKLPQSLKKLFWSIDAKKLDINKNKSYIIHQALAFGSLDDIKSLFKIYSLKEIRQTFLKQPKPFYSPQGLNFLQKYILQIKGSLPKEKYVKNIFGPIIRP